MSSSDDKAYADTDRTLYQEARNFIQQGQVLQACHLLEASSRLNPHFKTLEILGECYLQLDRPTEAIVPLAAASFLSRQFRAPTLLAEAFLQIGNIAAAKQAIDAALRVNPRYRRAIQAQQLIIEHLERQP